MKTIKLKIKEQEITLNFEAQELLTLNQYLENCEKLKGAPLLQNFPVVTNIQLDFNEGSITFEITDFQYEQVYDLLHRARPFFLRNEPASFEKVNAIFGKQIKAIFGKKSKDTNLAKALKEARFYYEKGDYQLYFQAYVGKVPQSARDNPEEWLKLIHDAGSGGDTNLVPLFHEKTLDTWLNGSEYHQDRDKAEAVKRLEEHLTQEVARGIFVSQISGRLKTIFWLEKIIKTCFELRD